MSNPFASALQDYYRDEQRGPLLARSGETTREQALDHYFDDYDPDVDDWLPAHLDGPLLDVGAGAGRHALSFQEQFETVAIEQSEVLVELMRDRGVRDARVADMFALREAFDRDRFGSVLSQGTQTGLAGSMVGLRELLADFAHVTGPDGTAVIDGFDPTAERTRAKIDFRPDPTPGLAYRVFQPEYDGALGEPWLYRLFTPEKLREATVGTDWTVVDVRYGDGAWDHVYNVALAKR